MPVPILTALAIAGATSTTASPGVDSIAARILIAHNRERAAVGAPPLQWDPALAADAAAWAPRMAASGRLFHSPRAIRPGQRENLAMAWTATASPELLVGQWAEEKRLYRPGLFPAVSSTGRWLDVAHYTQMIWKRTTRVGCAVHDERGWSYLVCRYTPPGNRDGQLP